jgi:peptidoglycan/xylan/chitin deacetylase (PgdA/CDA1 family)
VLIPDDGAVRVGESIRIHLLSLAEPLSDHVIEWHTDLGRIQGDAESATFTAPREPGAASIVGTVVTAAEDTAQLTLRLPVYRQWVVLKADDLTDAGGQVPPGFVRLFRLLADHDIVASVGLIGRSLETGSTFYAAILRKELATGRIEIFSHCYDHSSNGTAAIQPTVWEFKNTPLANQIDHLRRTQDLARLKLNVTIRSFGAPYNAVDSVTVEALRAIPELQVWLFGLPGSGKLVLPRVAELEFPLGNPDAAQFIAHYDAAFPVMTLQMHPAGWNTAKWLEFEKIVEFLKERQVTFALPSQLYRYQHPDAGAYLKPSDKPTVAVESKDPI